MRANPPDSRLTHPLVRAALIFGVLVIAAIGGWLWFGKAQTAVSDMNRVLQTFRAAANAGDALVELSGADAVEVAAQLPGFKLPAGAADVHLARQGRAHALYWLRFSLPAGDVDAFLRSACFPTPLEAGFDPGFEYATSADVIANLDWWMPRSAATFAGGRCNPAPDVTFRAVVDETGAAARTVYFEISTGLALTIPTPEMTP